MAGIRGGDNGGVGWADNSVAGGLDGDAITDGTSGENRIGDFRDWHGTSLKRRGDGDGLGGNFGCSRGLGPLDCCGLGYGFGGGSWGSGGWFCLVSAGLTATGLGCSLLVVITIVAHDNQSHRGEERSCDRYRVQPDLVEGRDGQQGSEDKGRGVQTAARTDDDTTDETADQHGWVNLFVTQVDAVEAGLGDTTEQTGG